MLKKTVLSECELISFRDISNYLIYKKAKRPSERYKKRKRRQK
jgi:hypothetical protein